MALSSTEAEYYAAAAAVQESAWIAAFMEELGYRLPAHTLWCDNQSAIATTVSHARSKHIAVKYHFIREKVAAGAVVIKYVNTRANLADVFTKALPSPQHKELCSQLLQTA